MQPVLAAGAFALVAVGLAVQPGAGALSTATVCLGLALIAGLYRRRMLATLLLALFLLYGLVPVWAMQVIGGVPLSNWRGELFAPEALHGAVRYYCVGFAMFALGVTLGLWVWQWIIPPAPRRGVALVPGRRAAWPAMVALFLAGATAATFAGVTRDVWIGNASTAERFVMQATTIATIAAFGYNLEHLRRAGRPLAWLDLIPLLVAVLLAVQGFRFMLVAGMMTFAVSQRDRLSTRPAHVARVAALALAAYLVLTLGMGVRAVAGAQGISLAEAITQIDATYLSYFIGAPEQTGMVALKYFTETSVPVLHGRTYLDAVFRLLPNALHTSFFDTLRPQDFVLTHFAWVSSWFRENELTIGAHLFLEGIINFGPRGGLWVAFAAGALIPVVDLLPARRDRFVPMLYGVSSFAFAAAWYGSSAFLKTTIYYVAVFLLLQLVHKIRLS